MKPSNSVVVLCVFLLAFFSAHPTNASYNSRISLFEEAGSAARYISPQTQEATTIRSRMVHVSFEGLGTSVLPAASFELNLFNDTTFTAIYERSEENLRTGFSWIGYLEGIPLSQVVLIISDDILTGSVSMPGANYTIRSIDNNLHIIEEVDHSKFPPELEPISLPQDQLNRPLQALDVSGDELCNEITVLVAYTPEARAAEGGTAAMEARIDLAMAETNQSYINSGINNRITLVHTIETSPGDAANSFYTDLYALRNLSDGTFDSVDAYRELYHADLVGLIINNSSSCGLGYLNSTASTAFTVTHRTCATGYYSFGHEFGHNMGARHDWYVDDTPNANKAYVNTPNSWRTIMGYNTLCSDLGGYCSRLQYWSNPDINFGGDPMGIATNSPMNCTEKSTIPDPSTCAADNRTKLNSTCNSVANFRKSPDLSVLSPGVDDVTLEPGQTYTLSATIQNLGGAASDTTTLRYYLSSDTTIFYDDSELGSDPIGSLSPSATSTHNIAVSAPSSIGTYYVGSCVNIVPGETSTGNNCSSGVQITVNTLEPADLIVRSLGVSDSTLLTGQTFTISATVLNQGETASNSTTLRYYLSDDANITTGDSEQGNDSVGSLSSSTSSSQNIAISAPNSIGTYYVGACVDPVAGETVTNNNCSSGVMISVSLSGSPDLIVQSPSVSNSDLAPGQTFTLSAFVENGGDATSNSSTLKYYLSDNEAISSDDAMIGSDTVVGLAGGASSPESISVTAPNLDGTYYLGGCVDSVAGETAIDNNCSTGVQITVSTYTFPWPLYLPAIMTTKQN